tara:strand:- start:2256 stop:2471 length:216 start_codon:yes stop_codon:yes gene_type:complete
MEKEKIVIKLNGKNYSIMKDINIETLIKELNLQKKSFALALNSEVVKKENFRKIIIQPNSKIEIISAVGGG